MVLNTLTKFLLDFNSCFKQASKLNLGHASISISLYLDLVPVNSLVMTKFIASKRIPSKGTEK